MMAFHDELRRNQLLLSIFDPCLLFDIRAQQPVVDDVTWVHITL